MALSVEESKATETVSVVREGVLRFSVIQAVQSCVGLWEPELGPRPPAGAYLLWEVATLCLERFMLINPSEARKGYLTKRSCPKAVLGPRGQYN